MKFSSRLLFGILMSSLSLRGSYEKVFVNQSPSSITEGKSAEITCCWNRTTKENTTLKVAWHKNNERLNEDKRLNQTSSEENCSVLNIINTVKNDSGDYFCKAIQDIPVLAEFEGTKTTLNVTEGQNSATETTTQGSSSPVQTAEVNTTSPPNQLPLLPLFLASAFGLLTLCLALSICKMRNSCKNADRVVIHQSPHSEGEEHENMEEEDGSTGSSRGSLQWYQVPVYWSYFDLQRGEEQ